jgi:RimJ/RimL family protein N-acetyltransferase
MAEFRLETERLILRGWKEGDLLPFYAMCTDPQVMEHLGPSMAVQEVRDVIGRQQALQETLGHCFWALERKDDGLFIGFCGIKLGPKNTPIEEKPEIGWRLSSDCWGQGYAREAAQASVSWGFANLTDDRIWAITTPGNERSWGLMLRLGMVEHPELGFDHPDVPETSILKRHVTWSIGR